MINFNKRSYNYVFVGLLSIAVLGSIATAHVAFARSALETPYPVDQIWSTAVRFLRVDQRFPVLEKDKDAGYILFDYVEESTKVHKASLELVAVVQSSGRQATKVVLTIPDKPRHVEALILEKLQKKAIEELGTPLPPPPRPKRDADRPPGDKPKGEPDTSREKEDPNRPVRGDDGLPRLPHHKDLPRPQE